MQKFVALLIFSFLIQGTIMSQAELSVIESYVQRVISNGTVFEEVKLFTPNYDPELRQKMDKVISKAFFLDINPKELRKAFDADHQAIRFIVPVGPNQEMVINAIQSDIFTNTFSVTTQEGVQEEIYKGRHYKGAVEGAKHTFASISVFKDQVIAIFGTEHTGDMVLGQMDLDRSKNANPYVVYDDNHLLINTGFECHTPEPDIERMRAFNRLRGFDKTGFSNIQQVTNPGNCLKWYFECDFEFFQDNGSDLQAAVNEATALYNAVAAVFENESINNELDGLFIWTEEDPYNEGGSSGAVLGQFQNLRTPLPGNANVAHLVSVGFSSNQGIAGSIGGICPERAVLDGTTHAFNAAPSNDFGPFPEYSWIVSLIAHENGHVVGSYHTHGCYWFIEEYPDNGEPLGRQIDDCGNPGEGNPCYDAQNPIIPSNFGTIMSYCSGVTSGQDLRNGFGAQPGNIIRDYIFDSDCVASCGAPSCPTVNNFVTEAICAGEDNAAIDLELSGGTPPYTFIWSTGATTEDIDGLAAGIYSVTINDASGDCEIIRVFDIVASGDPIVLTGDVTPVTSDDGGAIDITVSGGSAPFSYLWSNGATTEDISGLSEGTYSVTVTDSRGCEEVESFVVSNELGCAAVISDFPFSEGFETNSLGVFGQGSGDDFNWQANSGSTPTGRTGPSGAAEGSFYVYAEATGNARR